MASITFNFTAAQSTRIQQATDSYNIETGQTLTPKQWCLLRLKQAVQDSILQQDTAAGIQAAIAALNADLTGSA